MGKNLKRYVFLFALLCLAGCATLSPEQKKELAHGMSETDLHEHLSSSETSLEGAAIIRNEIVSRHPEWKNETKQSILDRKVLIGMTKDQVLAAWGSPDRVSQDVFESGATDYWVYEHGDTAEQSLYFINDKLKSIGKYTA